MKIKLTLFLLCASFILGIFPAYAQNFLKVAGGFSFSNEKEFVQSFTFELNRTEEVKEKAASHYFLYTKEAFYIIPTIDVNIGESIAASENNVVTQVNFGKKIYDGKTEARKSYLRFYLEGSPVYNADKDFNERKYYGQLKLLASTIYKFRDSKDEYFRSVLSLSVNPLLNLGTSNSKTFATNHRYMAAGFNTEIKFRINQIDTTDAITEKWVFKVSANGYRLYDEIDGLYSKEYYGQISSSVDYAISSQYGISITYKYGNDNAKYTTANVLEVGFKIKY